MYVCIYTCSGPMAQPMYNWIYTGSIPRREASLFLNQTSGRAALSKQFDHHTRVNITNVIAA